jgi:glycosyltransferase involved in cell wall biosynthesis
VSTRVSLLTEIPAPYRIPLFNALAARPEVELDVIFLRARNPDRPYRLHEDEWRFGGRVLAGRDLTVRGRWLVLNTGAAAALRRTRPDVVVLGGWNQPAFWVALAWARARRVPVVLWVESTLRDARPSGGGPAKRLAARAAAAFVVPGQASRAYVHALAPAAEVVTAPNAVDTGFYASRLDERDALRAERGLTRPCVLYVGRLAPEKAVDVLVAAARGLDADVVLAGTGPEERHLREQAPPNVRFLGHVERDELPGWYAAADVLCLPSRSEPWGFPLNEAAAAGLPLVATDAVGAAHDLLEDGVNGFRVPPDDVGALHGALARLCGDGDLRQRAAARSRELSGGFTPKAWADAVARLLERVAA